MDAHFSKVCIFIFRASKQCLIFMTEFKWWLWTHFIREVEIYFSFPCTLVAPGSLSLNLSVSVCNSTTELWKLWRLHPDAHSCPLVASYCCCCCWGVRNLLRAARSDRIRVNEILLFGSVTDCHRAAPVWVFTESKTSTAQVDSPLFPHIFLHQAVEQKHKEALQTVEENKQVHQDYSGRPKWKKANWPREA